MTFLLRELFAPLSSPAAAAFPPPPAPGGPGPSMGSVSASCAAFSSGLRWSDSRDMFRGLTASMSDPLLLEEDTEGARCFSPPSGERVTVDCVAGSEQALGSCSAEVQPTPWPFPSMTKMVTIIYHHRYVWLRGCGGWLAGWTKTIQGKEQQLCFIYIAIWCWCMALYYIIPDCMVWTGLDWTGLDWPDSPNNIASGDHNQRGQRQPDFRPSHSLPANNHLWKRWNAVAVALERLAARS